MKKMNSKGFTLIELLAVITIMGILMMVAIPNVSRTIENSRRDTFMDNAIAYAEAVRKSVLADELKCGTGDKLVSSLPEGTYYFKIDTTNTNTQDLMEKVAKSSWGQSDMKGYVKWKTKNQKTTYYVILRDESKHGMAAEKQVENISRGDISTNLSTAEVAVATTYPSGNDADSGQPILECKMR